jgi:hypothetical protein
MDQAQFVAELGKLRSSSMFLTLKGYRNNFSEIADYQIVFHISYRSALEKSISMLESLPLISNLEKQARDELLASFGKSLSKAEELPIEEREDGYTHFLNEEGKFIKGVKLHDATNTLHIYGLINWKRVLMPGIYKSVNSSELTIAKNKLRYLTQVGRFRQFKITSNQVDCISVQNLSLLPPDHE